MTILIFPGQQGTEFLSACPVLDKDNREFGREIDMFLLIKIRLGFASLLYF